MSQLIKQSHATNTTPLWARSGAGLPVGSIVMYSSAVAPDGWLYCNGAAVSRTDFLNLFEVIGTAYGAGDGLTTFNLPNTAGRLVRGNGQQPGQGLYSIGDAGGADSILLTANNLPAHLHAITDPGHNHDVQLSGMFSNGDNGVAVTYAGQGSGGAGLRFIDSGAALAKLTGITTTNANVTTAQAVALSVPSVIVMYIIKA